MTHSISDAQLVAFLHGELDESETALVEAAINADEGLAMRAEALADQDDMIREAFAPVLTAEVPERHRQALGTGASASNVVDFASARKPRSLPSWGLPQFAAMAASLALGLFAGQGLMESPSAPATGSLILASADGVQVTPAIGAALAQVSSGQPTKLAGLGELEVAITFRAADERLCRQFALRGESGTSDGVACRDGSDWQLEALGRRPSAAGEIRTAGGEAAPSVIAAVDGMIAGDALVGEDEAAALR